MKKNNKKENTKDILLSTLNLKMHKQSLCLLKKTSLNVVSGEGNPDAVIMLIGEAPGKKEDETGRPFVGASGRFLEEMLSSVNLSREDVYITNILKYRPPENRDPTEAEVKVCWPWLEAQVKLIDPKIIVTLGRYAMNQFLPSEKISIVHGVPIKKTIPGLGERIYLPFYHPAAALYNGSLRETLKKDFKIIVEIMRTIN